MKILYVMDPVEKINVMGDSTFVLMMESQKRFGGEGVINSKFDDQN